MFNQSMKLIDPKMNTLLVLIGTLVLSCSLVELNSLDNGHLNNIRLFDFTKDAITEADKSLEEISQFGSFFGAFQFTNQSVIATDWRVIEFKLQLRWNETVFKVEIFNKIEQTSSTTNHFGTKHHKFTITLHLTESDQGGHPVGIDADYDVRLHQVNITITKFGVIAIGFAVWDITLDTKTPISPKQIQLHDDSSDILGVTADPHSGNQLYLITSSTAGNRAYMNFTFDDPDSAKEYCFYLLTSPKAPIEVYMSVFGQEANNRPLTRHSDQNNLLCPSSYIYVRQLGQFNVSFVFTGHVSHDSTIVKLWAFRLEKKEVIIKKIVPRKVLDSSIGAWLYNNPRLFDYTVLANLHQPTSNLYVCDILAYCYPYERKQAQVNINNQTVDIWNYTLGQEYKQLLSHSPLIRLHSNDSSFTFYSDTPYFNANEISLTRIQSVLQTSSQKLQFLKASDESIFYRIQVPKQTQIPLQIPIHTIDLRAQTIIININQLNKTSNLNNIHLVQVKVNGMNKLDNISHSTAHISTGDYIQVAAWQLDTSDQVKSFEIEFEVKQSLNDTNLVDLEIQFSVEGLELKPTEKQPKFGNENCIKGPTFGDLDCHSEEYQCPEYYFKYDPIAKTCTRTDEPKHQ